MRQFLVIFFMTLSVVVNAKAPIKNTQLYKNKKYGFSFEYPKEFRLYDDSGVGMGNEYVDPPINMTHSIEVQKKECPSNHKECIWPTVIRFVLSEETDGTEKNYLAEKELNQKYRQQKYDPSDKILNVENVLNNNLIASKITIAKNIKKYEKLQIVSEVDCKKSKTVITVTHFSLAENLLKFENFERPIKLEEIYNLEQMQILNSFKCPEPNFFKKGSKSKKI